MKLTRNLFIPCLDTSEGKGEAQYVPIDLSTVFDFSFNPKEETYAYICDKNDSTEVTGYNPQLPQEIALESDNPMYAYLMPKFMAMPTGGDLVVPCLIVMPDESGKPSKGYLWEKAQLSPQNLNPVDGKLSFNINLNGDKVDGTVTKEGGKIAFAKAA